jgi:hypothetical protein
VFLFGKIYVNHIRIYNVVLQKIHICFNPIIFPRRTYTLKSPCNSMFINTLFPNEQFVFEYVTNTCMFAIYLKYVQYVDFTVYMGCCNTIFIQSCDMYFKRTYDIVI